MIASSVAALTPWNYGLIGLVALGVLVVLVFGAAMAPGAPARAR